MDFSSMQSSNPLACSLFTLKELQAWKVSVLQGTQILQQAAFSLSKKKKKKPARRQAAVLRCLHNNLGYNLTIANRSARIMVVEWSGHIDILFNNRFTQQLKFQSQLWSYRIMPFVSVFIISYYFRAFHVMPLNPKGSVKGIYIDTF